MAPAPPLGAHTRPYKDYLTPALHRRFIRASRYTLLLCYLIACWMGEFQSFVWLLVPIGPTGMRALVLFIPALTVYVLRVAQWHVGPRQTQTRAEAFNRDFVRTSTLLTLAFYAFSAWLYNEVYVWSRPGSSRLAYTDYGRAHERLKLNERPLYLRYLFLSLALVQAVLHLYNDHDNIALPAMAPRTTAHQDASAAARVRAPKPRRILVNKLPKMVALSAMTASSVALAATVLYFAGLRQLLWDYHYNFSRYFISLAKTSRPTGLAPYLPLAASFVVEGTLLVLLWAFVNEAFSLYIAQEPLKHDTPITSDSNDPNGTLLNGLKSKKDTVKAMAFWELALITDAFPDRRATIYREVERKKAPTFQQITDLCLAEIKLLIDRVNVGLDPAYNPPSATGKPEPPVPVNLVPQIAQPLKDDKAITVLPPKSNSRWDLIESATADIAKQHSSPGNAQQAYGREALNKSMEKAQQGAHHAESAFSFYYSKLVASPLGSPFRRSLARTAKLVVLGAPYSRLSLLCNAITALTNLAVFSIREDTLGRFNEGVPSMIRIFTSAISKLEEYMDTIEVHWSDYETAAKPEAERKKVPEVEQVKTCLKQGLESILQSFGEYLSGMGMSRLEVLEAKKAVRGKGKEMVETEKDM